VALKVTEPPHDGRLARFGLTTHRIDRLGDFYQRAFDCRLASHERRSGDSFARSMNVRGGAWCATLALGRQHIELLEFDDPGDAYPAGLPSYETGFQHFAIVVADMCRALHRLEQTGGWSAISTAGPQRLPHTSNDVTAFKFRDPEGHPLEFLEFSVDQAPVHWRSAAPGTLFLGIDHSAISILNVRRSVEFYEGLGLNVTSRSLNRGREQQDLDGVTDPVIDVIALSPPHDTPHVELLCYHTHLPRTPMTLRSNDVAATRLVFRGLAGSRVSDAAGARLIQDPDGHYLQILGV